MISVVEAIIEDAFASIFFFLGFHKNVSNCVDILQNFKN